MFIQAMFELFKEVRDCGRSGSRNTWTPLGGGGVNPTVALQPRRI